MLAVLLLGCANPPPEPTDKVRVELGFPAGVSLWVGDVYLATRGAARVEAGAQVVEYHFDDGRTLRCPFVAEEGTRVRYLGDGTISVDEGSPVPCE